LSDRRTILRWLQFTNEEVFGRVNEDRQTLSSIWQRKHWRIGHVLRHNGLLHEITEGRVKKWRWKLKFYTIWQMMVT